MSLIHHVKEKKRKNKTIQPTDKKKPPISDHSFTFD